MYPLFSPFLLILGNFFSPCASSFFWEIEQNTGSINLWPMRRWRSTRKFIRRWNCRKCEWLKYNTFITFLFFQFIPLYLFFFFCSLLLFNLIYLNFKFSLLWMSMQHMRINGKGKTFRQHYCLYCKHTLFSLVLIGEKYSLYLTIGQTSSDTHR